jgi:response regulator of citrate/malate metabolism
MKKSSLSTILSLISTIDTPEAEQIRDEINTELAKGQAKADANRAAYAELHDKVMEVLRIATTPVTAQEIAEELSVARGKIVYGLTNYWSDEVVKDTTGKSTTYALA